MILASAELAFRLEACLELGWLKVLAFRRVWDLIKRTILGAVLLSAREKAVPQLQKWPLPPRAKRGMIATIFPEYSGLWR